MTALVRYTAADALRAQRWVAPTLVFLAAVALFNSDAGALLTTYADTTACLLPVAAWLTVAVVDGEDPVQTAIVTATVGSDILVRLVKLLTAYLACIPLIAVATAWPLVAGDYRDPLRPGQIAAGVAAHLIVALAGVAFGSVATKAVTRRTGWAVLLGVALCLADVTAWRDTPLRQILTAFDRDHPAHLAGSLATAAVETLAIAATFVGVAATIARRRS